MSKFPRHSEYRNSGNKWIGNIPSHWHVTRYKNLMRERKELSTTGNETLMSVSAYTGVTTRAAILEEGEIHTRADSLVGYKKCAPDDLVINIMLAWNRGLGFSKQHGIVSPAYCVFRKTSSFDSRFVNYLVRDDTSTLYYKSFSTGLMDSRLRLYPETFLSLQCALPNIHEQEQIADFLDRETSRIDALIAKRLRFNALLHEKLIAMAAFAAEDPSSIKLRLGQVVDVISRPVYQDKAQSYTKLGLLNRGRGIFRRDATETEDMGDSDFFWVKDGDLILSGQFAWEGAVAIADETHEGCVVSHRFPIIKGKNGIALTEYIFSTLLTDFGGFILNDCSRGSAGRNRPLNLDYLLKWKISVPPLAAQEKISSLYALCKRITKQVSTQIQLLEEHRSALITAAVTGKIDVRKSK